MPEQLPSSPDTSAAPVMEGLGWQAWFTGAVVLGMIVALVRETWRPDLVLLGTTAALSAFVNNTPLVAILIPRLQHWAERQGLSPSKVMLPLSYAAVLGGTITLIGTSTNLVVAGLLEETTGRGLRLFDFTWVGLPVAAAGIAYFALIGYRLLPDRTAPRLAPARSSQRYTFELRVSPSSPLAGHTVAEAALGSLDSAYVLRIQRGNQTIEPVGAHEVLGSGDVLTFAGEVSILDYLMEHPGLERASPRRQTQTSLLNGLQGPPESF